MTDRQLTPIVPGQVRASILALEAPISFWGGVDNLTGRIIDRNHPQVGEETAGRCLVVPSIRGSGGTPGNLAMLVKLGKAPAGIVIGYADINVMTGVLVAEKLYSKLCPLFLANETQLTALRQPANIEIETDGVYQIDRIT